MSDAAALAHPLDTTTGVPNGKLGMWTFLASEVMFFAGLIGASIVLRAGAAHWPHPGEELVIPIGTVNTFILILSSMTMVLAHAASVEGDRRRLLATLGWTILLGSAFLGIKAYEYSTKFAHGHLPSSGIFWSCYFVLTGFHALHVLGGIITNGWLWVEAATGRLFPQRAHYIELAGLYWHFVDIVWILLFPLLYLI